MSIQAQMNSSNTLYVYGPIVSSNPWGDPDVITPSAVADALKALGELDTLYVAINTPGGDAFAGSAITALIERHPAKRKVMLVDGLASSAGSYILLAGDERLIAPMGEVFIHDCWAVSMGNATQMRKLADDLDKLDIQGAERYAARTNLSVEEARAMMHEETFLSPTEAVELGFCSGIAGPDQKEPSARAEAVERAKARMTESEVKALYTTLTDRLQQARIRNNKRKVSK